MAKLCFAAVFLELEVKKSHVSAQEYVGTGGIHSLQELTASASVARSTSLIRAASLG